MAEETTPIRVTPFCEKHLYQLVHQAKYKETDSWQAMVVVCQIAMFQGLTTTPSVWKRTGGDVSKIEGLGCPACRIPTKFIQVINAAKTHKLDVIKALGEKWVFESNKEVKENEKEKGSTD